MKDTIQNLEAKVFAIGLAGALTIGAFYHFTTKPEEKIGDLSQYVPRVKIEQIEKSVKNYVQDLEKYGRIILTGEE